MSYGDFGKNFIIGIVCAYLIDTRLTLELFVKYPIFINIFILIVFVLLISMFILGTFMSDKYKELFKIIMMGISIYFIVKSGFVLLSIPKAYIENWFAYQLPGAIPPVSLGTLFSIFRALFLASLFSILERIISLPKASALKKPN